MCKSHYNYKIFNRIIKRLTVSELTSTHRLANSLLLPGFGGENVLLLLLIKPVHLVHRVHDLHAVVHLPAAERYRRLAGARRAAGRHRCDTAATWSLQSQAVVMILAARDLLDRLIDFDEWVLADGMTNCQNVQG